MTDKPRDTRFQVSADRTSASRRVRYVETNKGDVDDCTLCQLDEGVMPVGEGAEPEPMITAQEQEAIPLPDEDDEAEDQFIEAELIQAIENQLLAQQPPAVQAVFNKLTLVGHTRDEIVQMMAQVLAWQISEMLGAEQPFNRVAYERALRALPQLPEAL